MDLSKAYGSLPHDFIVAKLEANGFDLNRFCFMHGYLDCFLQRVQIGSHNRATFRFQ